MQVGDYITGIDRSYPRTIYVIEEIICDGMQARCWARYYDGLFFYRNDKHNFHLCKLWLNEYRPLGRNDYDEVTLAKAQFMLPLSDQRTVFMDIDSVIMDYGDYEGIIVRSGRPGR